MIHSKKYILLLLALATTLLLFSACSPIGPGTGGTSGGSKLTVAQVLQNSSKAMSRLKSVHIDLKANGTGQALNTTSTTSPPSTTATPITGNITFSVTGTGDEALPQNEAMQFDATQTGATNVPTSSHIEQIVQGDKIYIKNAKTFSSTVDLWIDEATFYVHRTELKLKLDVNAASLSQSITPTVTTVVIPSNVTTTLDSVVDLSKFNEPVTVTPPLNAIATD